MTIWPTYLSQDYAGAAVRLATVLEAKALHLIFGCVELYPKEVPLPPSTPVESRNLGEARLYFGIYPMSLSAGLAWYEDAARGNLVVPGATRPLTAAPLGPEPMLGRLVSANDVPFAPVWHSRPRLHRLVPLSDLEPSLTRLIATEESTTQQKAARTWLAERLHFDVLAQEEWLGGLALLVPNPAVRSFRISVIPDLVSGRETVRVLTSPRQGVSTSSLSVTFREVRFGAVAAAETVRVDPHGRAELQLPESVQEIAAELHCDSRGLLAVEAPSGFVRTLHANVDVVGADVAVEVPSPRSGGKSTTYRRHARSSEALTVSSSPMPSSARRLIELSQRQRRRSGEAQPDALWSEAGIAEVIFHDDRKAASDFIRNLIERARRNVILVDPFFDHVSLREFGIATSYSDMPVHIMLGRDHLWNQAPMPDGQARTVGDIIVGEMSEFRAKASSHRLSVPDLRLMGGDCRKYHDRFLVLDDEVWHCGHSFNQVGRGEVSMMTRLRQPDQIRSAIMVDLDQGEPFEVTWRQQATPSAEAKAGDQTAGRHSGWQERFSAWVKACLRWWGDAFHRRGAARTTSDDKREGATS